MEKLRPWGQGELRLEPRLTSASGTAASQALSTARVVGLHGLSRALSPAGGTGCALSLGPHPGMRSLFILLIQSVQTPSQFTCAIDTLKTHFCPCASTGCLTGHRAVFLFTGPC